MLEPFGLYLVLTDPVVGYVRAAEAAVAEKVRFLQLRIKNAPPADVLNVARRLREITRGTRTQLIVNDLLDAAMASDADGIHLGQEDLSLAGARRSWNKPGKLYGLSTHSEEQAKAALPQKPDYIGVGPVFPTPTKETPDPAIGLEGMERIIRSTALPAVAIGGIDKGNLPDVLAHGAVNFAVVRAVCQSQDPAAAIRELMDIWRTWKTGDRQ